jgi:PTS system mannitol-specific IIA component
MSGVLDVRAVRLAETADDRDDAIRRCAAVLVAIGAVKPSYEAAMLARELTTTTYVGEGMAIPHGTYAGREAVRRDALAVLRFPDGVDWDGHPVTVCVAIAARGDGHVAVLASLAGILLDKGRARALRECADPAEVVRMLAAVTAG